MAFEVRHFEPEEPYRHFSVLSLLPQTIRVPLDVKTAASEPHEMDYIGNFFKSVALNGSTKLLEQAQVILKSKSDTLNHYSEDGDKAVITKGEDRPHGRRPAALGRKRAQFSLKPTSSHSLANIDFASNIDHLEDPEEFFSAVEKLENADKELKKLRGEVYEDQTHHHQSVTARKRRPGILGKKVSYKHNFLANADTAEAFRASQEEIFDRRNSTSSKAAISTHFSNVHPEETKLPGTLQARETNISTLLYATERQGSVAKAEKRVHGLLNTLLSSFEGLDEGEGAKLLQERLHIKSTDVGKICLPDLDRIQRNDLTAVNNKVTGKNVEGSLHTQTSPILRRSPLAAISKLFMRSSQKDPLEDPYSKPYSEHEPYGEHSSLVRGRNKHTLSPPIDIDHRDPRDLVADFASVPLKINGNSSKFKDGVRSTILKKDRTTGSKITSEEPLTEDSLSLFDENPDHNSSRFVSDKDMSYGLSCSEEEGDDMMLEVSISKQRDPVDSEILNHNRAEGPSSSSARNMGGNSTRFDTDTNANSCGFDGTLDDKVNDMLQEASLSQDVEGLKDDAQEAIIPMNGHAENPHMVGNNENQEIRAASGVSVNKRMKQKTHPCRGNKQKSKIRRQSLAGAGTIWKSGVRRSTRIKSRPLEYWRGERFLYGRIHDSLATVIGLKYASPDKGRRDPVLKVKSYVPEKYAQLVAKAALH